MSDQKTSGPDIGAVKRASAAAERTKLPATTTVKLSRFLREYVVAKAEWNESIDHALRRLLGLPNGDRPAEKIEEPDRKVVKEAMLAAQAAGAPPTVTVKVSRFLREYVSAKGLKTESIDITLRRLLGLPVEEKAAS